MTGVVTAARVRVVLVVVVVAMLLACTVWIALEHHHTPARSGMRLDAEFDTLANGVVPATFDDGRELMNSNAVTTKGDRLHVVDGALTVTPVTSGKVAGYLSTPDMGAPISEMGATFTFRPGTGTLGAIALVISQSVQRVAPQVVPPLALHLVITPINWNVAVMKAGWSSQLTVIGAGTLAHPLATDGRGADRVVVRIDGGRVQLSLPDGTTTVLDDPRVSQWQGHFATFEVFANHGTTDANGAFRTIWAVSGDR